MTEQEKIDAAHEELLAIFRHPRHYSLYDCAPPDESGVFRMPKDKE